VSDPSDPIEVSAPEIAEPPRSDAVLRSVFETLPMFIMTLSLDAKILNVSKTISGMSLESVIGASAYAFMAPDFHEAARRTFEEVIRTEKPSKYDALGPVEGGGMGWYTTYVGPIFEDGRLRAMLLATQDVSRDIARAKELEQELREAAARTEAYARELEEKNALLLAENAERVRTEAALRAVSAPIMRAWDGVLALPIIGAMDGARAARIMEMLLGEIVQTRARFAVLDLTGADAVDTSTVGNLLRIVRAASLLGSECLVSGISPSVAQTIVTAGGGAEALHTFGTLQDALRYALQASGVRSVRTTAEGSTGRGPSVPR
jgi:PAS domain S-box-containing protein